MTNLTTKEIQQLKQLVNRNIQQVKNGPNILSLEELENLEQKLSVEEFTQQINDFKSYLDNVMSESEASEETWEDFYNLDWQITFGGRTIKLFNQAAVYNAVYDLMNELLEE